MQTTVKNAIKSVLFILMFLPVLFLFSACLGNDGDVTKDLETNASCNTSRTYQESSYEVYEEFLGDQQKLNTAGYRVTIKVEQGDSNIIVNAIIKDSQMAIKLFMDKETVKNLTGQDFDNDIIIYFYYNDGKLYFEDFTKLTQNKFYNEISFEQATKRIIGIFGEFYSVPNVLAVVNGTDGLTVSKAGNNFKLTKTGTFEFDGVSISDAEGYFNFNENQKLVELKLGFGMPEEGQATRDVTITMSGFSKNIIFPDLSAYTQYTENNNQNENDDTNNNDNQGDDQNQNTGDDNNNDNTQTGDDNNQSGDDNNQNTGDDNQGDDTQVEQYVTDLETSAYCEKSGDFVESDATTFNGYLGEQTNLAATNYRMSSGSDYGEYGSNYLNAIMTNDKFMSKVVMSKDYLIRVLNQQYTQDLNSYYFYTDGKEYVLTYNASGEEIKIFYEADNFGEANENVLDGQLIDITSLLEFINSADEVSYSKNGDNFKLEVANFVYEEQNVVSAIAYFNFDEDKNLIAVDVSYTLEDGITGYSIISEFDGEIVFPDFSEYVLQERPNYDETVMNVLDTGAVVDFYVDDCVKTTKEAFDAVLGEQTTLLNADKGLLISTTDLDLQSKYYKLHQVFNDKGEFASFNYQSEPTDTQEEEQSYTYFYWYNFYTGGYLYYYGGDEAAYYMPLNSEDASEYVFKDIVQYLFSLFAQVDEFYEINVDNNNNFQLKASDITINETKVTYIEFIFNFDSSNQLTAISMYATFDWPEDSPEDALQQQSLIINSFSDEIVFPSFDNFILAEETDSGND